jgi:putative alpha-1,2-mannosidase
MIGSPLFRKIVIHLPQGKQFVISAPGNSPKNVYIQSATLNGKPLEIPVLTWQDIRSGGSLELETGPMPSKWASGWRGEPLERFDVLGH